MQQLSSAEISDLMVKLVEARVIQSDPVSPALLPRLELAEPGKGEGSGTLLEMKDKLGADLTSAVGVHRAAPASADVLHALLALGYSDKEAVAAVKELPDGVAVADGIRHALKRLAKA